MDFSWFTNFWALLISSQEKPELWAYLASWVGALLLTFTPLWLISRNVITVVHEGGHALTGLLWGRRIEGIKLHSDTSGVTVSRGRSWGLGMLFTVAAGYTAPAILGLGIQWLIYRGLIFLSLFILTVLLAGIFLSIRNIWGLLITVPLLVLFYCSFQFSAELQGFFMLFLATFLTTASLKPIIELQARRKIGEASNSDADQLAHLTLLIPGIAWVGIFFAVSLLANGLTIFLQFMSLSS